MGDFANLFEQATQITKAYGYDILAEQVKELKEENERLKKLIEKMWMEANGYHSNKGFVKKLWQRFQTQNKL